MSEQIAFDLSPGLTPSFSNFITDIFSQAVIKRLSSENWDFPVLLLIGPEGVGKTHLGQAWLSSQTDKSVFMDDADQSTEEDLFIQLNRALNSETPRFLMTAKQVVSDWNIELPDLMSRLTNVPTIYLDYPSDEALEDIIRSLFEAKGRIVKADLVAYMLKHEERSVPAMRNLVDLLEEAARSEKKDLTKTFAAKIMKPRTV